MDAIAFAGTVVAWLLGLVVGVRLLRIAAYTHQTPELTIGVSYVLTGGFGFPPMLLSGEVWRTQHDLAILLQVFALFPILAGILAISVGAWRIFRPRERWPLILLAGIWITTGICAGFALAAEQQDEFGRWFWYAIGFATAGWVWMSVEAFRLSTLLSRRARYGLASAEVANRVLLWGVASVAAVMSTLFGLLSVGTHDPSLRYALRISQSAVQWACILSMWLAFFPPQAYRRRFAAPLGATAASGA